MVIFTGRQALIYRRNLEMTRCSMPLLPILMLEQRRASHMDAYSGPLMKLGIASCSSSLKISCLAFLKRSRVGECMLSRMAFLVL